MSDLLAYQIDDLTGDSGSDIVFLAARDLEAAGEEAGNSGFDFDRIVRVPDYDEFADRGSVPKSVLFSNGWYFYCEECERRTDDEEEPEEDENGAMLAPISPVFYGEKVFCCPGCLSRWQQAMTERKERKAEAIAQFERNFPGAIVKSVYPVRMDKFEIRFWVEGLVGDAAWTQGESIVRIAQIDEEAWKRYRQPLEVEV